MHSKINEFRDKAYHEGLRVVREAYKDAIINWCVNTKRFLDEARRLKAEKVRLPPKELMIRRWERQTNFLIVKIVKDMEWQENREKVSYYNDLFSPSVFLDLIPNEP